MVVGVGGRVSWEMGVSGESRLEVWVGVGGMSLNWRTIV